MVRLKRAILCFNWSSDAKTLVDHAFRPLRGYLVGLDGDEITCIDGFCEYHGPRPTHSKPEPFEPQVERGPGCIVKECHTEIMSL